MRERPFTEDARPRDEAGHARRRAKRPRATTARATVPPALPAGLASLSRSCTARTPSGRSGQRCAPAATFTTFTTPKEEGWKRELPPGFIAGNGDAAA